MRVVSIMNQKGGVGKTATAVSLAAEAARRGLDVLLLDADQQGSATEQLSPDDLPSLGLADVLTGEAGWREAVVAVREPGALGDGSGRLDLLAGDDGLMLVESQLDAEPNPHRLSRHLRKVQTSGAYDLVVIDGAPGVGPLVVNMVAASDLVVCPVSLSSTSVRGVARLRTLMADAAEALGEAPRVLYLPTIADRRLSETANILDALSGFGDFPDGDLLPEIRSSAAMSRAYGLGQTIQEHDPTNRAAEDYAAVYDLLAEAGLVPAGEPDPST
jgi:chromosome partitioning protein